MEFNSNSFSVNPIDKPAKFNPNESLTTNLKGKSFGEFGPLLEPVTVGNVTHGSFHDLQKSVCHHLQGSQAHSLLVKRELGKQ